MVSDFRWCALKRQSRQQRTKNFATPFPIFENIKVWYFVRIVCQQSVTCLVTDAKLTADPGVASSIPARSHTFVEIDHEIISTVILLPSAESFMKGCCQLQAKVCARLLVNCLFKLAEEKSVVRWTDRPAMTIAVDMGRKATKTNKQTKSASRRFSWNIMPYLLFWNTTKFEIVVCCKLYVLPRHPI